MAKQKSLKKEFINFAKKIEVLEKLKFQLESLDTKGYEGEARKIKSKLKDISKISEIRVDIKDLKNKIKQGKVQVKQPIIKKVVEKRPVIKKHVIVKEIIKEKIIRPRPKIKIKKIKVKPKKKKIKKPSKKEIQRKIERMKRKKKINENLDWKLEVLEKAFSEGYVSQASYEKGKERITKLRKR